MKFNPDLLGNLDVRSAARATMGVVDSVQHLRPEAQVAGIVAAFKLTVERYGLNVADTMVVVDNMVNTADGKRPEFQAVADFMKEEW